MDARALVVVKPITCPVCGRERRVKLARTIRRNEVVVNWCCPDCAHQWAVPPRDAPFLRDVPLRELAELDIAVYVRIEC